MGHEAWSAAQAAADLREKVAAGKEDRAVRPVEGVPAAVRPAFPRRLRSFMYACGKVSAMMEGVVDDDKYEPGRKAVALRQKAREE